MKYARIIIDISAEQVDRAFTYRIPEALRTEIFPGVRVKVPFGQGGRTRKGIVIELTDQADYDEEKIKEIDSLLPGGLDAEAGLIRLAAFMAEEYGCTMNQALLTVLPVKTRVRKNSRRKDPVGEIQNLAAGGPIGAKAGGEHNDAAGGPKSGTAGESQSVAAGGPVAGDTQGLADSEDVGTATAPGLPQIELNEEQKAVCDAVMAHPEKPSLLYGITGSGKTRVYMELIRRMQKAGKASIVLIPEISLTYQTVSELTHYFGPRVAVMHSKLSAGEKYDQYVKALNGEIDVMAGPRSALFTPFRNLGLIIIDEEHERTYQSETSPRYDARTVAEKRAAECGALLLMGSATPSLGSYKKALEGTWQLHVLKHRAHPGAVLPKIYTADMRKELQEGNRSIFSAMLQDMIRDRLGKKEQVMLFLNRRGYAGFVSCRSCGTVIKCPHCDVSLTAHNDWYQDPVTGRKDAALLSCHYCGYTRPMPKLCPECGSSFIAPFGTGTQKLEQACRKMFPEARVLRMDADTTTAKYSHERILSEFQKGKADILVGTQMIVKGHDFANVTLVGIVAADLSLNSPEYDASERTYQLITQAAGRSGRADRPGAVVIQSYDPSHYAVSCAAMRDYEAFYEREMSYRRLMSYPPETKMLFLRFRAEEEDAVTAAAVFAEAKLREIAPEGTQIIGPCNEGIYKMKDNYRKIIYIKHPRHDIIIWIRKEIGDAVSARFAQRHVYMSFDIR